MGFQEKFQNQLHCTCNKHVFFEIIEDIECDWGSHTVIQCPKCEEIFSVDCQCPAFQTVLNLTNHNPSLFSELEKSDYLKNAHPK